MFTEGIALEMNPLRSAAISIGDDTGNTHRDRDDSVVEYNRRLSKEIASIQTHWDDNRKRRLQDAIEQTKVEEDRLEAEREAEGVDLTFSNPMLTPTSSSATATTQTQAAAQTTNARSTTTVANVNSNVAVNKAASPRAQGSQIVQNTKTTPTAVNVNANTNVTTTTATKQQVRPSSPTASNNAVKFQPKAPAKSVAKSTTATPTAVVTDNKSLSPVNKNPTAPVKQAEQVATEPVRDRSATLDEFEREQAEWAETRKQRAGK